MHVLYDLRMHTICQRVRSLRVREDLGALFARITRRLIELERPILDAHGLSMWGYVALNRLAREPPRRSSRWRRRSGTTRRG